MEKFKLSVIITRELYEDMLEFLENNKKNFSSISELTRHAIHEFIKKSSC